MKWSFVLCRPERVLEHTVHCISNWFYNLQTGFTTSRHVLSCLNPRLTCPDCLQCESLGMKAVCCHVTSQSMNLKNEGGRSITILHLNKIADEDVVQSHSLCRTHFNLYQASSVVLGWQADGDCMPSHESPTGQGYVNFIGLNVYRLYIPHSAFHSVRAYSQSFTVTNEPTHTVWSIESSLHKIYHHSLFK